MAQIRLIQFGMQSYEARSPLVSLEECQNLYLERNPEGAKAPVTLYGTPGLKLVTTVGTGPIRGIHGMGANLYIVSGNRLFAVDHSLGVIDIGEIKGDGNCYMIDNGQHVAIATIKHLYAANASGAHDLPEQYMVGAAYQDGYGIFPQGGSERFYISGVDDMTSISALDFSSADVFADKLVGCISDHRELVLFGERTTEFWHNAGLAAFPFVRAGSGFMERGCSSSGSIAKALDMAIWQGDDLRVYSASGYQPKPISTTGIDKLISERSSPQTSWAFVYAQEGHTFYALTFSDKTIVFNLTTGLWATRKSKGIDRWRANCYAWHWRKHWIGDYANGKIYELDLDTYDDDGDAIVRQIIAPPIQNNGNLITMDEFYVDLEFGVGLTTGQGSDPSLMLDWSEDGGRTWSNELVRSAGKIGEYTRRARWHRLGSFRQRSLRLSISDPVKVAIIGAYARMQGMST